MACFVIRRCAGPNPWRLAKKIYPLVLAQHVEQSLRFLRAGLANATHRQFLVKVPARGFPPDMDEQPQAAFHNTARH